MATQAEVAQHLGIKQPAVAKLVSAGVFTQSGRGALDLDRCRIAYLDRLREEAAGRASQADPDGEELDLVAERARLAKEQADRLEMDNAARRGELVPFKYFVDKMGTVLATVRTRLLSVPAECAVKFSASMTAAVAEAAIRDVVYQALDELSRGGGLIAEAVGAKGESAAQLRGENASAAHSNIGQDNINGGKRRSRRQRRSGGASGPRGNRKTGDQD